MTIDRLPGAYPGRVAEDRMPGKWPGRAPLKPSKPRKVHRRPLGLSGPCVQIFPPPLAVGGAQGPRAVQDPYPAQDHSESTGRVSGSMRYFDAHASDAPEPTGKTARLLPKNNLRGSLMGQTPQPQAAMCPCSESGRSSASVAVWEYNLDVLVKRFPDHADPRDVERMTSDERSFVYAHLKCVASEADDAAAFTHVFGHANAGAFDRSRLPEVVHVDPAYAADQATGDVCGKAPQLPRQHRSTRSGMACA